SVGYNNFPGPYTCTVGPSSGPISVTFSPIGFRAVRYDATRGLTYGAFVGIHATFSGLSSFTCSGVLDGTSATAGNGLVRFKYLDSFGLLQTFLGGGNLHLYNVSGCGGLINSGDALTVRASFVLASHGRVNTITGPQPSASSPPALRTGADPAQRRRAARFAFAGAATGVRDGGDRQRAGAGLTAWRQRPAPVRRRA